MAKVSRVSRWIVDLLDTEIRVARELVNRSRGRKTLGSKTKLPINRWMAAVFEMNELRALKACLDNSIKPLTDEQIKYNYKQEFGNRAPEKHGEGTIRPGGALLSGKHTLNYYRKRYKLGTLYAGQTRPILYPFRYSPEGHIVKERGSKWFPTFSEIQEECVKFKIADPRFFTTDSMETIHQYAVQKGIYHEWVIPTKEELEDLYKLVPIQLFRCIKTYDIWKKDPIKKDFTPRSSIKDQVDDEKVYQKEEESLTLEERRQQTLKLFKIQEQTEETSN